MRPILLVAWRASASTSSSAAMPSPSSRTRHSVAPPPSISISTAARAGVEAVLDQFLDHGRRALDDLAGGDLVDQLLGEHPDGHGRPASRAGCARIAKRRPSTRSARAGPPNACRSAALARAASSPAQARGSRPGRRAEGSRCSPARPVATLVLHVLDHRIEVTPDRSVNLLPARGRLSVRRASGPAAPARRAATIAASLRARRRLVVEVVAHAGVDRLGDPLLVRRVAQPALVGGVGDERRLDQHRRDVGRLEHHEARVPARAAVHRADAPQRGEHGVRRLDAVADRFLLRDVEQHRGEHVVLVVERHAAHQVGRVLALREPARRLVRRAAQRQHVHGRAAHVAVRHRIGVDRHEHVGAEFARLARRARRRVMK